MDLIVDFDEKFVVGVCGNLINGIVVDKVG